LNSGQDDPGLQVRGGNLEGRQVGRQRALLERLLGGVAGLAGLVLAVGHPGGLVGQHLLGVVDLGARQGFQLGDAVQGQVGEQLQEPADVGVFRVPPELPVVVGAQLLGVQPHRARHGLAHLGARGRGQQRRGQAEGGLLVDPARQLHAVEDVAPLVRAAHLQHAAMGAVQLQEVDRLHQHVVEFEEGHRLLALEPQLDRVEGQHPVDREVHAVVAQELHVAELAQPRVVVDHDGVGRPVAEGQELGEHLLDAGDVGRDVGVAQQLAALVLAGGVADLGRAAAHQDDRLVAGLLQAAQHHDLDQRTDVQRRGGGVEADVGGDDPAGGRRVQFLRMGDLVDVAARLQGLEEFRLEGGGGGGHGSTL